MSEKTTLGVKEFYLVAFIYAIALFGGLTPLLLVAGYCLIKETSKWVQRASIKSIVVTLLFTLISKIVSIIFGIIFWAIDLIIRLISGSYYSGFSTSTAVSYIEFICFVVLIIGALKGKDVKIPLVDKWVDKITSEEDKKESFSEEDNIEL